MAERKPAKKGTQRSATSTIETDKRSEGFTAEERAAMKERARELKAEARANEDRAAGERDVLAKIAEMPGPDRAMAERLHALIKASAPGLEPKTWYGMPAYAKDGKVVCFFKSAHKFKSRYATFGFEEEANLDEGAMWPTSFALKELTAADEAEGTELQLALNDNPAAKAYQQAIFEQGQPAAMFYTDDVRADYERIKARGAEFTTPPTDVTASTIAMLDDTCGNLIQVTELARG